MFDMMSFLPTVVTKQSCKICFHLVLVCLNIHPPCERGLDHPGSSTGASFCVVVHVCCVKALQTDIGGTSEGSDRIKAVHPATSISKQGTLHRVKGLNNKYTHPPTHCPRPRPRPLPPPVPSNHRATAPPPDSQRDCMSPASP